MFRALRPLMKIYRQAAVFGLVLSLSGAAHAGRAGKVGPSAQTQRAGVGKSSGHHAATAPKQTESQRGSFWSRLVGSSGKEKSNTSLSAREDAISSVERFLVREPPAPGSTLPFGSLAITRGRSGGFVISNKIGATALVPGHELETLTRVIQRHGYEYRESEGIAASAMRKAIFRAEQRFPIEK